MHFDTFIQTNVGPRLIEATADLSALACKADKSAVASINRGPTECHNRIHLSMFMIVPGTRRE